MNVVTCRPKPWLESVALMRWKASIELWAVPAPYQQLPTYTLI